MKFRNKIILTILLPWIFSIILLSFLIFYAYIEEVSLSTKDSIENISTHMVKMISSTINDAVAQMKTIVALNAFNDYITLGVYNLEAEKKIKEDEINDIFKEVLKNRNDFYSMKFSIGNKNIVQQYQKKIFTNVKRPKKLHMVYREFKKGIYISETYYDKRSESYVVSILYKIKIQNSYIQENVILGLEVSLSSILKTLSEFKLMRGTSIHISNKQGKLIYPSYYNEKAEYVKSNNNVIPYIDWNIELCISKEEVFGKTLHLGAICCVILLIIVFTVVFIIIFISRYLSRPTENLIALIRKQEKLPLDSSIKFSSNLGRYGSEFKEIASALEKMMESIIQYGQVEKKSLEWKSFSIKAKQVAHDIESPLSVLNAIVKRDLCDNGLINEQTRIIIVQQICRIHDIINDLKIKNRFIKNEDSVTIQTELLSTAIQTIVTEKRIYFRSSLKLKIIEDIYSKESYGLFALINLVEFKRVVSNLVNNAADAIPNHESEIKVILKSINGSEVGIIVQDTGIGIPEQILPQLGKKRVSYGKEKSTNAGEGLGLFHAKQRINEWNGSLTIKSKENVGTEVIIKLPKANAPKWFGQKLTLMKGQKVIVLDDDQGIHDTWACRLTPLGFELIDISNPIEFENQVQINKSFFQENVILSDYELLSGNGVTGLDLIEKYNLTNCMLVTSYYEKMDIRERCIKLDIKIIPKMLAGFVPIEIIENSTTITNPTFGHILLAPIGLIRSMSEILAAEKNISLLTVADYREFSKYKKMVPLNSIIYISNELEPSNSLDYNVKNLLESEGYLNIKFIKNINELLLNNIPE